MWELQIQRQVGAATVGVSFLQDLLLPTFMCIFADGFHSTPHAHQPQMSLAFLANISFAKLRIDAPASKRKPTSSGHFGERSDSAQMAVNLIALSRVLLTKDADVLATVAASVNGAELMRRGGRITDDGRDAAAHGTRCWRLLAATHHST